MHNFKPSIHQQARQSQDQFHRRVRILRDSKPTPSQLTIIHLFSLQMASLMITRTAAPVFAPTRSTSARPAVRRTSVIRMVRS